MPDEYTSAQVAKLAAKGLNNPLSLFPDEIRVICASALTQAKDHPKPVELPDDNPPCGDVPPEVA